MVFLSGINSRYHVRDGVEFSSHVQKQIRSDSIGLISFPFSLDKEGLFPRADLDIFKGM